VKKPDEIMAEYLLKGGKMLAKTCAECGNPLFEYKGTTLCVVCDEQKKGEETGGEKPATGEGAQEIPVNPAPAAAGPAGGTYTSAGGDEICRELIRTIVHLCGRVRGESDPENCLSLMEAIARGIEALTMLSQR
jgi:UPF0148 protein